MTELITKILLYIMRKKGEKTIDAIEEASQNAGEYSRRLLLDLLHGSKDSEYGKKYHFDQIKSVDDYKKMVPVTVYDDYAPYIERMVKHGEQNVLTGRKVVHFAQSSGSVGVPKYIPVVKEVIDLYSEVGASRTFALAGRYLKEHKKPFPYHKSLNLVEVIERKTECGIPKGAISSTALKHVRPTLKYLQTTPMELVFPTESVDQKYLKLLFALAYKDLAFLDGAFTTSLVDIMVYLTNNWQSLVEDIRTGTISSRVEMSDALRKNLEMQLKADPKRAGELEAEFEKGFDTPILPRIWPKLTWTGGIGTGTFAPYTQTLKKYTGEDMPHDNLLYAASESIFACCPGLNREDFLMIPQSGFYEFVPAEADDCSKTYNIDELEVGKDYEIIVTNLSGLYRYRIFDVIRVMGYYGKSPLIQFVYRKNQLVNLASEKTNTEALEAAITGFKEQTGVTVTDYSVYPDTSEEVGRYVFLLETGSDTPTEECGKYAQILDEELGKANPAYMFTRKEGELAPAKVMILEPQTNVLWRDLMIMKGTSPNQIKPVRVIDTPVKEKFFLNLVEE